MTHAVPVGDADYKDVTGCVNKAWTETIIVNNPGYRINETVDCVCWQYGTEKICELKEWHQ